MPRIEFIALIAAMMALNALAIDVMLPAFPNIGESLGVAVENDRQYMLTVYMLGFGVSQLVYGPLSDRFGRRAPLLVGIGIYMVAALLTPWSPSYAGLLALRFIQGIGAAGTRVISQSIVRDTFSGRAMAEIMSLVFMIFMLIPIIAPGIGQVLLLAGHWSLIFVFMAALGGIIGLWVLFRLPETLRPEDQRSLRPAVIIDGFRIVFSNRMAMLYAAAGIFIFAALNGYINLAQQIYVDIYGLGVLFPFAFGAMGIVMAISNFMNSRMVGRIGMRRLSHYALLGYLFFASVLLVLSLFGIPPLWLFMTLFALVMFHFGWIGGNMNALSMEPLGKVAGTASAVFGFLQTVGGALIGLGISQSFNGTLVSISGGYALMGALALGCVLLAEKGRLFGVGAEHRGQHEAAGDPHDGGPRPE
ncbi:MAG: multidrug effflux MFS transporter [Alphaproteobacteria bacterium]|nr:multidrug effflux MFS transporter [Alphaproteobacteria bacterium]